MNQQQFKESITVIEEGPSPNNPEKVTVKLGFRFNYIVSETKENGLHSCFIPSFGIAFSAESFEEADVISESAMRVFMKHWGVSRERFMHRIRVLGFAPTTMFWPEVIKKKEYAGTYNHRPNKSLAKFGERNPSASRVVNKNHKFEFAAA